MKRFFAVLVFFSIGVVSAQHDAPKKYDSIWEGKLNFNQNVSLRIVVKIQKNEDGTFSGFLDSPDQGAKDIPATSVKLTEDSLKFDIKQLGASYAGMINKDSMIVNGVFKQGATVIDAKLKKTNKLEEARRPQNPVKPYSYNEEEIIFQNESAKISLAGTLTFPKGNEKYPAVVLITGSGRQDRDETVYNHKPFLVIADYLTRSGIAVLRFDDRGGGKSSGDHSIATTEDFATDAAAAVQYLKSRNEIDSKKIGLIGHSEGGIIAPMTAVNSSDVSFIVLLAGPGVAGKDLLPLQTELILKSNGMPEEEITKNVKQAKEAYEAIVSSPDSITAFNKLKEMFDKEVAGLSDEEKQKPEYSADNFNAQTKILLSPWFRFFLRYDPTPMLENVSIPVLALNGDKDLQVDAEQNLTAIENALKDGGNTNYKIEKLPDLNHMFQTAKTGALSEYAQIEETFSPSALKLMSDWIKEMTSK